MVSSSCNPNNPDSYHHAITSSRFPLHFASSRHTCASTTVNVTPEHLTHQVRT
ncbi:hypothetical protein BCR44DRAFT_34100 [Catenaria anguillulae PL171]|uniref:Uncharacterized protein n=1 Tax=Catenaria anguillulae PL171 TaxID=765915 RepID=A0A1Y2HX47_9FUNG|nr:hypothetical protein BCR44DRAFT_34100 [Catenaria anguillulae PL171]